MKKIKLTGKLVLNKETIARLNNKQMSSIYGGGDDTQGDLCAASAAGGWNNCGTIFQADCQDPGASNGDCVSGAADCSATHDGRCGEKYKPSIDWNGHCFIKFTWGDDCANNPG